MAFDPGTHEGVVFKACKKHYTEKNQVACNFFFNAVCKELGIPMSGQADDIVKSMETQWLNAGDGQQASVLAQSYVVAAGLHSSKHALRDGKKVKNGHVGFIVDGPLYRGKYPPIFCGALGSGGRSKGNKSVGEVWRPVDRDNVKYFYYPMTLES